MILTNHTCGITAFDYLAKSSCKSWKALTMTESSITCEISSI